MFSLNMSVSLNIPLNIKNRHNIWSKVMKFIKTIAYIKGKSINACVVVCIKWNLIHETQKIKLIIILKWFLICLGCSWKFKMHVYCHGGGGNDQCIQVNIDNALWQYVVYCNPLSSKEKYISRRVSQNTNLPGGSLILFLMYNC